MSDIKERLAGYNPPDRTIDDQRQIAVDIQDALARITSLESQLREFDPDPVVCGCREAGCPHTPIAKLPRAELVKHFRERIASLESQLAEQAAKSNDTFEQVVQGYHDIVMTDDGYLTNDGLRQLEDRLLKAGWDFHHAHNGYSWCLRFTKYVADPSREQAAMAAYLAAFEE